MFKFLLAMYLLAVAVGIAPQWHCSMWVGIGLCLTLAGLADVIDWMRGEAL